MSAVVRSIDVGHGNTKYIYSVSLTGEIHCRLFPSVVTPACAHDLGGRSGVPIDFGAIHYDVGPGAELVHGIHFAQATHQDFTATPEYLALLRGALSLMETERVDLLVVGLPVSLLGARSDSLERNLRGAYAVAGGRTVEAQVMVLAQPLGGLIEYALRGGRYLELRESTNLVVDAGFFTLDWVLAQGIQLLAPRSGSFPGAMYAVLKCIAHAIGAEHGVDLDDWRRLDEGLRTGVFRLFGKAVPLSRYLPLAEPVIHEAVYALARSVGDGADIDNVVLVGGAAPLFRAAIERRFPRHRVHVVHEGVFANVRGLQRAGRQLLRQQEARVA